MDGLMTLDIVTVHATLAANFAFRGCPS
jgi:hypothetical protein